MYNQLLAMIMNCKRISIINILTSQWTYKACTDVWFLYQQVKTMVLIGLNSMNTIDLFINSIEFHYRMFSCFLLQDGKDYVNITKLAVDTWLYTGQRYL